MYNPDGSRIRALREYRELTQGQLAYHANTTSSQISRLENNERPGAHAATIAQIARALKTSVDYLVGLSDDPGIPPELDTSSPEIRAKVLELQRIWREVIELDPEAAQQLMNIAIVQAEAFRVAVNAGQRRIQEDRQEQH